MDAVASNNLDTPLKGNRLIVHSAHLPRAGWEARFAEMAEKGDDQLLDDAVPTQWDQDEWTW